MTILKGNVDGFSYFSLIYSYFIFLKQDHPCVSSFVVFFVCLFCFLEILFFWGVGGGDTIQSQCMLGGLRLAPAVVDLKLVRAKGWNFIP
jgi:hypothetical protein